MKTLMMSLFLIFSGFAMANTATIQLNSGTEMECSELKGLRQSMEKFTQIRLHEQEISQTEAIEIMYEIAEEFTAYNERCAEIAE